jgi:DNA-binding transcriptional ArsR family regulator
VLKQAGIVDDRKEGKKAIYRLLRPCVMSFFDCVERVLDENLKERQRVLSSS